MSTQKENLNGDEEIQKLKLKIEELNDKLRKAESRKGSIWTWARNYFLGTDLENLEKKNRRKKVFNNTLIGVLIGAGVGVPITFYCLNYAEGNYRFITYSILIAIFALGAFLFIFVYAKRSILKQAFEVEDTSYKLITENIFNAVNELIPISSTSVNKAIPHAKEASKQIAAYISYSSTRRYLFGILIGLIAGYAGYLGTMLLIQQNKLMKEQTHLAEASRRSSLIFLMSNIMDKVDEELKLDFKNDNIRNLSPETIGRLASLCQALKPYKYLKGNELIPKPLSPERGQLLLALVNSNLDSLTYQKIYQKTNFESSDLNNTQFSNVSLNGINLKGSDLSDAIFKNINFGNADLSEVIVENTVFNKVDFTRSDLSEIDFRNTNLCGYKFKFTNLSHSNFEGQIFPLISTSITKVDTSKIFILKDDPNHFNRKYDCKPVEISYSIFYRANLKNTLFNSMDVRGCSFREADLTSAGFMVFAVDSVDLRGAILDDVVVQPSENWFNEIDSMKVFGLDEMKEKYQIEVIKTYNERGDGYSIHGQVKRKK